MEEQILLIRRCARSSCLKLFKVLSTDPFITCPDCRAPLPDEPGGCTHWDRVNGKYQSATNMLKIEEKM